MVKNYGRKLFTLFVLAAPALLSMAGAQTTEATNPFTAVNAIAGTIATGVGLTVAAGVVVLGASMGGSAAYKYAKRFLGGR